MLEKPLRAGKLRRPWLTSTSSCRQKCGAKGTTLSTLSRSSPATERLARTKSKVLPVEMAASLQPRRWPFASVAMLVLANLSRSTFQSPAATQLGMVWTSARRCARMVALGSVLRPVPDWRYTVMTTRRHRTRGSSTARKPHPSTVKEWTSLGCVCQGVATTSPPLVRFVGVAPAQKECNPAVRRADLACFTWSRSRWVSCASRQSQPVC